MTHDNIDILVVDDDISHCTILQALLRGWGYNVALANSGRQALEQVRVYPGGKSRARGIRQCGFFRLAVKNREAGVFFLRF
mgnify:CR=1 FL=1